MTTTKKKSRKKKRNPLEEYMEKNSVVIRDLAWRLNVTETAVRNWIGRINSPTPASRIKIAKEMKLSLTAFNKLWDAWEN